MDKHAWPRGVLHRLKSPERRRKAWGAVRLGISLLLVAGLFYLTRKYQLVSVVRRADAGLLLLGVGSYVACQLASTARWYSLLRLSGFTPPFREVLRANTIGVYASNLLPGVAGGDALRPVILFGTATIHKPQLYASVVFERICGILSIAMLASVGAVWMGLKLADWRYMLIALLIFAGVLAAVLAAYLVRRLQLGGDSRLARAQRAFRDGSGHFLRYALSPATVAAGLGFSVLFQFFYIGMLWCLLSALDSGAPFFSLVLAAPLSWLAAMVPISVNGLGVREGTLVVIMTRFGVPQSQVAAAALLGLVPTFLMSAAGALWSLKVFDRHPHKISEWLPHE